MNAGWMRESRVGGETDGNGRNRGRLRHNDTDDGNGHSRGRLCYTGNGGNGHSRGRLCYTDNDHDGGVKRRWAACGLAACLLVWVMCSGCGTTIGADLVKPSKGYENLYGERAASGISSDSRIVLRWFGLEPVYAERPGEAIEQLFEISLRDSRREILFALAEMNYQLAKEGGAGGESYYRGAERFLTASVCAYYFLFSTEGEAPSVYDWRFRRACELHNYGLARALLDEEGKRLLLIEDSRALPCLGERRVTMLSRTEGAAEGARRYIPADQLKVHGLSVKVRRTGVGAPLVESGLARKTQPLQESRSVTLTMRLAGSWKEFAEGADPIALTLYSARTAADMEIAGRSVPVQVDLTAPLAYTLNDPLYWDLGMTEFFTGDTLIPNGLYPLQPYHKGLVPVVFVHGTMSSPAYWGEMLNTLRIDPVIRGRCQLWLFIYDTGKPMQFSARELQNGIRALLKEEPTASDEAFRHIVIVGHSQGGLLAKLAVTDTGDGLVRAVTGKGLDELKLAADVRELVCNMAVYEAIPEVKRVVFISTPHHGSYLASAIVRSVAGGLVSLPGHVLRTTGQLVKGVATLSVPTQWKAWRYSTSIDSMSPVNPALLALAKMTPAAGVTAHSIISVKDRSKLPAGGDGVVSYESAHVPYVASEFVVEHDHSCQGDPLVMEEVRRILLMHLKDAPMPAKATHAQGEGGTAK